ncbi:DUF433 domain-containing protein [Candidatus Collierbacteria bacterium]|nr:DUF433 domain-containing protein [Candidatus Collierbacteria bacterium]
MSIKGLIEKNSKVLSGTPVIRGTRIPVSLLRHLIKVGFSDKVITYEYPSLTIDKILAFKELTQSEYNASKTK